MQQLRHRMFTLLKLSRCTNYCSPVEIESAKQLQLFCQLSEEMIIINAAVCRYPVHGTCWLLGNQPVMSRNISHSILIPRPTKTILFATNLQSTTFFLHILSLSLIPMEKVNHQVPHNFIDHLYTSCPPNTVMIYTPTVF